MQNYTNKILHKYFILKRKNEMTTRIKSSDDVHNERIMCKLNGKCLKSI